MIVTRIDLDVGMNEVEIPANSIILSFEVVRLIPRAWVSSPSEMPAPTTVKILVAGTGLEVPDGASFIGTAVDTESELHAWLVEG